MTHKKRGTIKLCEAIDILQLLCIYLDISHILEKLYALQ